MKITMARITTLWAWTNWNKISLALEDTRSQIYWEDPKSYFLISQTSLPTQLENLSEDWTILLIKTKTESHQAKTRLTTLSTTLTTKKFFRNDHRFRSEETEDSSKNSWTRWENPFPMLTKVSTSRRKWPAVADSTRPSDSDWEKSEKITKKHLLVLSPIVATWEQLKNWRRIFRNDFRTKEILSITFSKRANIQDKPTSKN